MTNKNISNNPDSANFIFNYQTKSFSQHTACICKLLAANLLNNVTSLPKISNLPSPSRSAQTALTLTHTCSSLMHRIAQIIKSANTQKPFALFASLFGNCRTISLSIYVYPTKDSVHAVCLVNAEWRS